MKRRFVVLVTLLLVAVPSLYADIIDPRVGLDRDNPGNTLIGTATMTSLTLGPQLLSGIVGASEFEVINSSERTLFDVFVTIDFVNAVTVSNFTCDGHPTNWTCDKTPTSGSADSITFMFVNTDTSGGNLADEGTPFFVDLLGNSSTDQSEATEFNGATLQIAANVPEPGAGLLALIGLGSGWVARKRLRTGKPKH